MSEPVLRKSHTLREGQYAHYNQDGVLVKRLIGPTVVPLELDTHLTIAASVFGEDSKAEHVLFSLGAKTRSEAFVLWFLWAVGAIVGFLAIANVVPPRCVWASLLMLPLPIVAIGVMGQQIAFMCLQAFESRIIITLQILMSSAVWSLLQDHRCVWWGAFYPTMLTSVFIDAYPQKFRSEFTRLFVGGKAAVLIAWDCLLIAGWHGPLNPHAVVHIGHVTVGALPFSVTTSITLLLLAYRHLKVAFLKAETFIICKSELHTWKEVVHIDEDGEETLEV